MEQVTVASVIPLELRAQMGHGFIFFQYLHEE